MLTRRQFLIGLGATAVVAAIPLAWLSRDKGNPPESQKVEAPLPEYPDCDWVLDHVKIFDGTGAPGFEGRLAVKGEEIMAVGDFPLPPGVQVMDGEGLFLAPGFIDIHTHTESYVYSGGDMSAFLSQGVTAQIGGNCGKSPRDIADYFQTVSRLPINYGLLMGYATLRQKARGQDKGGKTTAPEISKMQEELYRALKGGAVGFSVGLEYWPQTYATTEELIALCEVLQEGGGYMAIHVRSEYDRVLEAVEEAIEIGSRTQVPVQYSHIKAGYARNWDKFPRVLQLLDEAADSGLDIMADLYSYTFSSTDLGIKPFQPSISEENLEMALAHRLTFIGSDSGIYEGGRANHPRAYGNCTRVLGRFVREKQVLTWETAIKKMTSLPAKRLNLPNRGLLQKGYKADLVLFNPETVSDKATRAKTTLFSEGIRHVWVNGTLAWSEGKVQNDSSGQVISGVGDI